MRYWPGFCQAIGRPELATDERFATAADRRANVVACVDLLDEIFARRPLIEWQSILTRQEGQWAAVQTTREVLDDEQGLANGYLQQIRYENGATLPLVSVPVQFDGISPALRPAPDHGADTEAVLLDVGLTWDELLRLKEVGAIS